MRVIEIVKAHLVANGFDGLVSSNGECGCKADDLAPCGDVQSGCEGGYVGVSTEDPGEWGIYRTQEAARASRAASGGGKTTEPAAPQRAGE